LRRPATSTWDLINFRPSIFQPDPAKSETWNRGDYLVEGLGHCGTCHTPKNITGGGPQGQALQGGRLQGWYAARIAPGRRAGLGSRATEEIVSYLKTGANSVDIASGPMAEVVENSTSHMTDADLIANATYLKDNAPRNAAAVTALSAENRRVVADR